MPFLRGIVHFEHRHDHVTISLVYNLKHAADHRLRCNDMAMIEGSEMELEELGLVLHHFEQHVLCLRMLDEERALTEIVKDEHEKYEVQMPER